MPTAVSKEEVDGRISGLIAPISELQRLTIG